MNIRDMILETITITSGEKAFVKKPTRVHADNNGPFSGQLFKDMTKQDHLKASAYHSDQLKKLKWSDAEYDKHHKYSIAHSRYASGDKESEVKDLISAYINR